MPLTPFASSHFYHASVKQFQLHYFIVIFPRCEASETTISCDSRDIASHESSTFSEQVLDVTSVNRCVASDTQISCDSPMDTSEPIGENSSLAETDPIQSPESITGATAGDPLMAHQPTTPPANQPDESPSQDLQASDLLQSSMDFSPPASLRKARSAQDLSPLAEEQPLASMTASMEQLSVAASVPPPSQVSSRVRGLPPSPSATPAKAQRSSSGHRRSSVTQPLPSSSRAASSSSSHRGTTRGRATAAPRSAARTSAPPNPPARGAPAARGAGGRGHGAPRRGGPLPQ
ncbi:hypothetical protein COOONC_27052, partial [Cooperia oncophora]